MPLINKPTRNASDHPSILDHIYAWTNQLYNTSSGIFFIRAHSGQNLAKLKIEVEHYLNNHVQINQVVCSNTNNLCNNLFVIYCSYCPIKEK